MPRKFNPDRFLRKNSYWIEHSKSNNLIDIQKKHHKATIHIGYSWSWENGCNKLRKKDALELLSLYQQNINKFINKEKERLKRLRD